MDIDTNKIDSENPISQEDYARLRLEESPFHQLDLFKDSTAEKKDASN